MAHQFTLFLLLFGALQGGLLSVWFLKNRRKEPANLYVGLFLLVVGLQLTLKVISKLWMSHHVRFLYLISYQLPYLVGPLLFLYVKARRSGQFRRTDWLHLVPFGLAVLSVGLLFVFPNRWRSAHPYTTAAGQALLLGMYAWFAYRLADRSQKTFLRIAVLAELVIIVTLAVMVMYYGRFPDVRWLFIVLTLLIYWVSYRVIAQAQPFAPTPKPSPLVPKNPKYARSSLKNEEADRIELALRQMMQRDKLFLDASLTIDTLAERLSTSRHHVSQVLNERLQKSYADYLNALRLEEARQRLSNPAFFHYTIAAVAFDSGFNSLASFNDVFRKQYGSTPSKFREPFLKKLTA